MEPYNFAVTCSVRVQIYNPITKLVAKNLSRFQEAAYGGSFRKDGLLLVAGDEQACVRLFNVSSKHILRFFKGHKAPVHRTFFTSDKKNIVSFSDDKSVKLWDIPTEKALYTFEDHNDYIRAGSVSPVSPNIIVSGGYDHVVKMYDTRTNASLFSCDHGSPVESLIFLPTGGIFISAGGTEIKVWDAFTNGKLLAKISQHHKTVTCLQLASNGRRLLSGSLDRHVKIYDVSTYQVVHNIDYSNAVLSLAVSKNDDTLVTGMVDGLVSIHRREDTPENELESIEKSKRVKHSKRFAVLNNADQIIPEYVKNGLAKHDTYLRKYEYCKALDSVLLPYVATKNPHITVSVIRELIHRKGLERAFAGRTNKSLVKILLFLRKNIADYRFNRVLIDATNILLNVYEDTFDSFTGDITKMFVSLAETLRREEELSMNMLKLQGALELLINAANVQETTPADDDNYFDMEASSNAKSTSIIYID